jgi:hypothetical protein
MALLFIGSTGDQAGHTLLTWAIINKLLEKGLRPGFFKPFGTGSVNVRGSLIDHDAMLFKNLLGLEASLERICPYLLADDGWRCKGPSQIMEACRDLSRELSRGKDLLIVMGSKHIFLDDASWPVQDLNLVVGLEADFILVDRFRKASNSLYSVLFAYSLVKHLMKGVVINRVLPENMEEVRRKVLPSLTSKGIGVASAIGEDPFLSLWSLREIADELSAEVLWGEEELGRKVWRMAIGSSPLSGSTLLFKRVYNKVILIASQTTGGEEDMNAFSSEVVAGILLTGGVRPPPQLIAAAAGENIPLFLVKENTLSAMERLERSPRRLSLRDRPKVDYFSNLLDREGCAIDRLARCSM